MGTDSGETGEPIDGEDVKETIGEGLDHGIYTR